jgi:hypothetical protein
MKNISLLIIFAIPSIALLAQPVTVQKKKKAYCNPLVAGQPATKRLSLVYEMQTTFTGTTYILTSSTIANSTTVNPTHSIRLQYNKTLVTKPNFYMTFAAGYWYSSFNVSNAGNNSFSRMLSQSRFHSITASSNMFKALNAKNFMLLNVSLESNGNNTYFENFSTNNLLAGGAIIYGWKSGFKKMWGVGVFRGYRLGKVIHVPALLFNQSFNKKWGVDALLPARANFRYTKNPKTMWLFGYELDGTQFAIGSSNTFYNQTFFQRGEIRPKIGLEKQLNKTWLITLNAGLRLNGRFDVTNDYAGNNIVAKTKIKTAAFVNAGVHMLRFSKEKK